jgi:hypothetical protein|uniref:Uncharacterized protein n=1 Tax=uncultured prokaryote TaxID=198431 RepID=A0A0H5Q3G9_9ZZZZ|nr:hypothetical protein [uncultured prokaryote]
MGVAMEKNDFLSELPTETVCGCCGVTIPKLDWAIGKFNSRDWMGLCIVQCESCKWVKVAAAGTSNEAHHRAQMMRWELIVKMEGKDWRHVP